MTHTEKIGGCITVIGGTGTGKTPYIKSLLAEQRPKNVVIYDPRDEYGDQYTVFTKFKYFKEFISDAKHCHIVIEEATGVVGSWRDIELQEWMIASEHRNCIIIFVFHTLLDAPKFILNKSKYVKLFPTGDEPKDVQRDRNKYFPHFLKVSETKNSILIPNTF